MLEKDFVPSQESLELKELGFDEPCFGFYLENKTWSPAPYSYEGTEYPYNSVWPYHTAPTFSQAFRFFRKKYQIDSWIYPNLNGLYSVSIIRGGVGLGKVSEYQIYEEAELECLRNLIEIVKNK